MFIVKIPTYGFIHSGLWSYTFVVQIYCLLSLFEVRHSFYILFFVVHYFSNVFFNATHHLGDVPCTCHMMMIRKKWGKGRR